MSAVKHYPTNPRGELDAGAHDQRRQLCTEDAWCALKSGHRGPCKAKRRVSEQRPITKLVTIDREGGS